jgi:4-amino-4-deoxy-L-arabinose transferase-like glycosyltransferase
VIYFAVQFGIRFFISTNLERDDAEMVGQLGWAWRYARSHPPLFHWVVRLCHDLSGSWVVATSLPKYALLTIGFLFLYHAGRRASGSPLVGALATAFLLSIPVIAWKTLGKFSHSILAFAAAAAALQALVLILQNPRPRNFAWLGLALTAGILAKYNIFLFIGALGIALLCVPDVRRVFCRRAAFLVPGLPLVLSAPHWLWIRTHPGSATENLYRLRMGSGPMGLELPARSTWDGLLSLVITILFSLTPLLLGCAVALLVSRKAKKRPRTAESRQLRSLRRLLGWLLLTELALFVASIFIGGVFHVHQQYLVALLPPFPLWLALQWRAISQSPAAGVVLVMGLLLAVSLTVARTLSIVAGQTRSPSPTPKWPRRFPTIRNLRSPSSRIVRSTRPTLPSVFLTPRFARGGQSLPASSLWRTMRRQSRSLDEHWQTIIDRRATSASCNIHGAGIQSASRNSSFSPGNAPTPRREICGA